MTDIDGEILEEVLDILEAHQGPDNPVTSGTIADRVGIDDGSGNPKTREAIRILSEEQDIPVAAGSRGYFMMTEPAHLSEYLEKLDNRIEGIEKRKETATRAWNRYRYARDEDGGIELRYGEDDGDRDDGAEVEEVSAGD